MKTKIFERVRWISKSQKSFFTCEEDQVESIKILIDSLVSNGEK